MKIGVKTAATSEPVTLNEAKTQSNVFHSGNDSDFLFWIATAREWVEEYKRICLMQRTLYGYLDAFPCLDRITLFGGNLTSVTSVKYVDADNVEHTFDSSKYYVDTISEQGQIILKDGESWPEDELRPANGVVIEYVCGFASADSVPNKYKQSIRLLTDYWYENRGAAVVGSVATLTAEIEFGARNLIGGPLPLV